LSEWHGLADVYSGDVLWRMLFPGILRRVALVWIDISEERIASIIRLKKSAS
jgi:hypothetical protein